MELDYLWALKSIALHISFGLLWLSAFWAAFYLIVVMRYIFSNSSSRPKNGCTQSGLLLGLFLWSLALGLLSHVYADFHGLGF